jgi:hypothetical protein
LLQHPHCAIVEKSGRSFAATAGLTRKNSRTSELTWIAEEFVVGRRATNMMKSDCRRSTSSMERLGEAEAMEWTRPTMKKKRVLRAGTVEAATAELNTQAERRQAGTGEEAEEEEKGRAVSSSTQSGRSEKEIAIESGGGVIKAYSVSPWFCIVSLWLKEISMQVVSGSTSFWFGGRSVARLRARKKRNAMRWKNG